MKNYCPQFLNRNIYYKNNKKMKKITVFGGSGFLGSHVVDKLLNRGFEVIVCDQEKSNYLKENQIFKKCNILHLNEVRDAVKGSDIVYNFAALECWSRMKSMLDNILYRLKEFVIGQLAAILKIYDTIST